MDEIKTDLFPETLRAGKNKAKEHGSGKQKNIAVSVEPLPESQGPRKDGPGGN